MAQQGETWKQRLRSIRKAQVPSNFQSPVYTFKYRLACERTPQITGLELVFYVHNRVFFLLAAPCSTWDPINSSPSRDWTSMPCTGSTESQPQDHQGSLSWSAQQGPVVWFQQSYIFRTSLVVLDENPLANPRGHGFNSWSGKIPHAEGQLSLWAPTTEPIF